MQNDFLQMGGGGSKVVRNFSENLSALVPSPVPKRIKDQSLPCLDTRKNVYLPNQTSCWSFDKFFTFGKVLKLKLSQGFEAEVC